MPWSIPYTHRFLKLRSGHRQRTNAFQRYAIIVPLIVECDKVSVSEITMGWMGISNILRWLILSWAVKVCIYPNCMLDNGTRNDGIYIQA